MRVYYWRRTTFIAVAMGAFLVGLGLARQFYLNGDAAGVIVSLVGLFWLVTLRRRGILNLLSMIILTLLLGVWRGSVYTHQLTIYQDLAKQTVVITGIADNDAVYADKSQLSFDITNIKMKDPLEQSIVGKMGIKGYGETMVYRGDTVQAEGKLYPTRGSKQAIVSFADISTIQVSTNKINSLRRGFSTGITSALPEPLASFGLGLLIGQRTTLPKNFTNQLSAVGLTHIVAVSGYNLTIILLAVNKLLGKRSKYQATLITICLIGLFLLMTGYSASIVRAAVVSSLSLAAWYYGRIFKPTVILFLSAVVTAGWYPIYIWSDLGWWLSFLAFAGILIAVPVVRQRFLKNKEPKVLTLILLETTAAQIFTLPLIMYIFGKVSIIALLANALIVPLVPIAMLSCFAAGLGGMLIPQLAGWVAWPAKLVLGYMVDLVQVFARLPHAYVGRSVSLVNMIFMYIIIVALMVIWRLKSGIITGSKQLKIVTSPKVNNSQLVLKNLVGRDLS